MNVWITVLAVSFGLLAAGLYVVVRRLRRRILELEVHSARAEQRATAIAEQCEQERRRVEALELSSAEAAQRERALIEQRSASAERVKVLEQA